MLFHSRFRTIYVYFCVSVLLSAAGACNKLVSIPNPITSITASQTFSSNSLATAAMLGIYANMSNPTVLIFSNGATTIETSLSADDLTDVEAGTIDLFADNTLSSLSSSSTILSQFWQPAYYDIYSANAVISGVLTSTGITDATRNQLIGEAKFIRAFCYFYLTNIFGDVPLVLTTDFNQTVLLTKSPQAKVYQQIVADLLDAQTLMIGDFSLSGGQPIRANKWAATALLARAYLCQPNPDWKGADSMATLVINSGQFVLLDSLDQVFLANSKESILQLQTLDGSPWATQEGFNFIPFSQTTSPYYWLNPNLVGAFEANDQRWAQWVDSTEYNGTTYYYPYKYRSKSELSVNNVTENYTVLRLAEQYLIRAEAAANLGQLQSAINDLNTIRTRAGLDSLSYSLDSAQVLTAVQQEDRIEFFAEWGHRWFDIRRWGIAIPTLNNISYKKGNINSVQLLYPIPSNEIQTDPNLKQNPGY